MYVYVCIFVYRNCYFLHPQVVLNMLLRLAEHERVTVLLTCVLDCCSRNPRQWEQVSAVGLAKGVDLSSLDVPSELIHPLAES